MKAKVTDFNLAAAQQKSIKSHVIKYYKTKLKLYQSLEISGENFGRIWLWADNQA
jgi:hypothetical protein